MKIIIEGQLCAQRGDVVHQARGGEVSLQLSQFVGTGAAPLGN